MSDLLKQWVVCLLLITSNQISFADSLVEEGRRIYEDGVLASGELLKGVRLDDVEVEGKNAACTNCHRASGLGGIEAGIKVPPIHGAFLFPEADDERSAVLDPIKLKLAVLNHEIYNDESFAKVIKQGVNVNGSNLNKIMPRYGLDDHNIAALKAYLQQLSKHNSEGVKDRVISFATIFTPDVSEQQKKIYIDLIQEYFRYRNANWTPGGRKMRVGPEAIPRTERQWDLLVWTLEGDPATWNQQLHAFYKQQPVFAAISGASNTSWDPVAAFCQEQKLPCLFPGINLAPKIEDKYNFFFSKGVTLDAEILASYLKNATKQHHKAKKIVQVYRNNFMGQQIAGKLHEKLDGFEIKDVWFDENNLHALDDVIKSLSAEDLVVFWLNKDDFSYIEKINHHQVKNAYFSGYLGNMDAVSYPQSWKKVAKVIYPYEMYDKRMLHTINLNSWLNSHGIALQDEKVQSEVLFDMYLLDDVTGEMMDNLYRDYMIEKVESILSQASNTTIYPSVSLGPNQRLLSKSGYIVKFVNKGFVAVSDRIIP